MVVPMVMVSIAVAAVIAQATSVAARGDAVMWPNGDTGEVLKTVEASGWRCRTIPSTLLRKFFAPKVVTASITRHDSPLPTPSRDRFFRLTI